MQVEVLNSNGQSTGRKVELADNIFGIDPHSHVVYLAVKAFLANQRQGTHKAKTRSEIAGSTRKLHKQKGTGGSRKGSIKNPLFHGGGRIFGPVPRDYTQKVNKKTKSLARKSVLSAKAKEGNIMVIEDFTFDSPKTSQFKNVLTSLNVASKRSLFLLPEYDDNVYLSGRNLQETSIIKATDFNVYEVLKANCLVISESAIKKLEESFA
jgi:large subunit ribosomal protein L4